MDAVVLMVVVFVGYILAYKVYGKFLSRKVFNLSDKVKTPAVEFEDGTDYVPTKKGIIFGHHFTSIAGTGPIVGPAIGVIWGWLPAVIWVLVGTIVMGAVHDFGSLVISLRNQGKSISDVTGNYINKRTRSIFFVIVLLELWIVIAIFGLVIAVIFSMYPQSVFPVWMQLPIAIVLGYFIYKKGVSVNLATAIAVITMYVTVVLGTVIPITLPVIGSMGPTGSWTILLLIYAFVASTLPVTTLLQPRDYINAWQLMIAMALLVLGVFASAFTGNLQIVAPAIQLHPEGAPSMWPFLFITIACGAISGFHALVASGTSSKQVAKESDALAVGYGSMIMEGTLATLVIIAVTAGIGMAYQTPDAGLLTGAAAWTEHYSSWAASAGLGSKISAFVIGAANMAAALGVPKAVAVVIFGVFVASFAGTTLDTSTRLQRYVIQELADNFKISFLKGKYSATAFAVITALILAFYNGANGNGALTLWPLFGAVNQTLAGLSLIVITLYLKRRGGSKYLLTLFPAVFMIVMTVWALVINESNFIASGNILLIIVNALVLVIALWVAFEGILAFNRKQEV